MLHLVFLPSPYPLTRRPQGGGREGREGRCSSIEGDGVKSGARRAKGEGRSIKERGVKGEEWKSGGKKGGAWRGRVKGGAWRGEGGARCRIFKVRARCKEALGETHGTDGRQAGI